MGKKLKIEIAFDDVWERIKQVTKWGTYTDLANFLTISSSSITGAKERGNWPIEWAFKVSQAYNVSIDWLLTGAGEMRREERPAPEYIAEATVPYKAGREGEYVYIPLYDVRAAAGGGAIVDTEHVVDILSFKASWIRSELRANPSDLYLIFVQGEGMEPTLRPGDIILIDRREANMIRDGIYVLRLDGGLLVKRLQRLPGQVIAVTSDNPAYKPFNINLGEVVKDLEIIGRVVWCGRRI